MMDKAPLTLSAEAKEAIEAYLESNPAINERFKQPATTGSAKTVIILFLIVAVAYWWFKGQF